MGLNLPRHTTVSEDVLRSIAERQGLSDVPISRLPDAGIFNAIYLLGNDLVLWIPRNHPAFAAAIHKETIAVPLARAAGVRTPDLVAFDDSLDLLPVPYAIYERVHGETLAALDLEPADAADTWRELGRDLALLHHGVGQESPAGEVGARQWVPEPRALLEVLATGGYVASSEARGLSAWLDRLAPAALTPVPKRFSHGDTQTTNVMVRPESREYLAVIDWGSAGWADPALDFTGVPLRAVPFMLAGYREVAPLERDDTAEARILWAHLQLALFLMRRQPQPGKSWAERPLTMVLETARFFLKLPPEPWRGLAP